MLRSVFKGPQGSNQAGQLLRHLPRLLRLLARLLLDRRPAGLGLVVGAGGVPDPELLQGQVLGEQLGVAQALQDGVHEAGVAVVLEAGDTWHLVAEGEPPAVAVVGRERPPGGGLQRSRVVLLVLSGLLVGAEMRKGGQSPENSVHEAPHGAHRAPAEELLAEGFLLFAADDCRHDRTNVFSRFIYTCNTDALPPCSEHLPIPEHSHLLSMRPGHVSLELWGSYGDGDIEPARMQHCIGLHKQPVSGTFTRRLGIDLDQQAAIASRRSGDITSPCFDAQTRQLSMENNND